ncbi:hypothetical protein OKW98_13125 [Pseudomonas sp. KU26590]|uniref:hypothetical protein n=1 Tax=Pseudomonas sp. KU26590 TaxID=2991051 RepID=UPI00223CE6F4|nr:hypothetical protein [Pseudomonas sp. KU26590]UZJ62595.1 hypothetical protein OKW98_13125 [Pseudomonas sp. KU26590]
MSVQPAPTSRFAVSGFFVYEDQKQIKGFPAKAGPTGDAFPAKAGPTKSAVDLCLICF